MRSYRIASKGCVGLTSRPERQLHAGDATMRCYRWLNEASTHMCSSDPRYKSDRREKSSEKPSQTHLTKGCPEDRPVAATTCLYGRIISGLRSLGRERIQLPGHPQIRGCPRDTSIPHALLGFAHTTQPN